MPRACITVIQMGARLHYAVPQILAQAGLLKELITDIHGDHPFFAALDWLMPAKWKPVEFRRLLGRRLPAGLRRSQVSDHPIRSLAARIASAWEPERTLTRIILAALERQAPGRGDIIYTSLINDDLEVMQRLRERGAAIVHECIITPESGSGRSAKPNCSRTSSQLRRVQRWPPEGSAIDKNTLSRI